MVGREEFVMCVGVSLIIHAIIVFSLSEWLILGVLDTYIFVISMLAVAMALAYVMYEFAMYVRNKITIKDPIEPVAISTVVVGPLYLAMVYGMVTYIAKYVFESIGIVEFYVLITAVPVILFIITIYLLTS